MQDILWSLYFLFLRGYAKLSIVSTDQTARMYNLQGIHQDSWQDSLLLIISMSCQTIMPILSIFTAIQDNCCLLFVCLSNVLDCALATSPPQPPSMFLWQGCMACCYDNVDPDQIRLLELFNQDL